MEQKEMIKFLVILSLVLGSVAHADCDKVTPIDKGQVSQCDGYYFPEKDMIRAQSAELESTFLGQINIALVKKSELENKENEILQRRLELYQKQASALSEDVARRDSNESLYRIGYFALGALVTGFIASNVSK